MNKNVRIIFIVIALILLSFVAVYFFKGKTPEVDKSTVNVYFSKLVGSDVQIEPVTRALPEGEQALEYSVRALMEGPNEIEKDKGFFSEVPEGTRLIDVKTASDQLRINLNKQFMYGGGSNSIVTRLKQLVYTSIDAEPVREVYLDVAGEQVEVLGGEGLEVLQPLSKDNFSDTVVEQTPEEGN